MVLRHVFALAVFAGGCEAVLAESRQTAPSDDIKPLWEVGVGAFAGSLPDYPAAGQNTERALAVPYLVYRGDFWRVGDEENRGAVSGRFLKNDWYEFDITLSAAFPVDSADNNAREDMPDLDFLFGIGPQLIFKLVREPARKLDLSLQARAVYATDFSSISRQGYVFNPKLSYSREHLTDFDLKVSTSVAPIFATEKLMDYFYQVDPEFATPVRPAYDADGGYLGTDVTLGVSKRFNNRFRLLLAGRLGIHSGATNRASPLFEDEVNLSVFSAFVWSFAQSERPAR